MARIHVFADEAGNFDFSSRSGASRYFILTTVTIGDFGAGDALLALRRQLAWEGEPQAPMTSTQPKKYNVCETACSLSLPSGICESIAQSSTNRRLHHTSLVTRFAFTNWRGTCTSGTSLRWLPVRETNCLCWGRPSVQRGNGKDSGLPFTTLWSKSPVVLSSGQ